MILRPFSIEDLSQRFAEAHAQGNKIDSVCLAAFNRLLEHTPEDMTASVEGGMALADFQDALAQHNQWLPIDPPNAERLTIGELLANNASGPRRFGHGTVRDYLIGIRVALADGRVIKAGGKVVKNVAGYDLCKLFVGSRGTIGVIVDATFKLKPKPDTESFVQAEFDPLEQVQLFISSILDSELAPTVLDLHNIFNQNSPRRRFAVVLGFEGSHEEVEFQLARARELGAAEASSLAHERQFWLEPLCDPVRHRSVLPSELIETIAQLGPVPFVARAGNGLVWYRGGAEPPNPDLPRHLMDRVKTAFDPKRVLPELLL